MQLVDELSMIYTTCLMVWATFAHKKRPMAQFLLAVALIALALFITGYYHYLQDPKFHQNMYAFLTIVVLVRSMFIMERNIRPTFKKQKEARAHLPAPERKRQEDRDQQILTTMWIMIGMGLTIFLGGFAIWNLDNMYCSKLRVWRRELGLPWGLLLEGHGWWHLMTGTGAYFYITWGIWLRHCLNGRQDEFELYWPQVPRRRICEIYRIMYNVIVLYIYPKDSRLEKRQFVGILLASSVVKNISSLFIQNAVHA
ncbi:hypothetical protein ANO11243_015490 [Dothideomycetidae sp. 11243]|nr:hypothetical protein ANO11243_015490 [fungal sp. No.11243]